MIENCDNYIRWINNLKTYTLKFEPNGIMKVTKYSSDCSIENKDRQSIILINYNQGIHFVNNNI